MPVVSLRASAPKAKKFHAKTADGWKIALHRYEPRGPRLENQAPVFLCHGLGANRYNLDAPGRLSLARWLCEQGFDCWVVELRGAGRSSRPHMLNRLRYDWTFDDYVQRDIPAALNLVRKKTGSHRVHWVGHSMGGMVAYAYLMTQDQSRLRSLTAIASPSFARIAHPIMDRIVRFRKLLRLLPRLPYTSAGFLLVPLMPLVKETVGHIFGNPRNLRTRDLAKLVVLTPTDLPTSLIMQFGDWWADKGFCDSYNNINYARNLHRITTPSLIMAGAVDYLTPPPDLEYVFDNLAATDKRMMTFGRANGCRHDYGHIDLVLGHRARLEVWPHILDWLRNH